MLYEFMYHQLTKSLVTEVVEEYRGRDHYERGVRIRKQATVTYLKTLLLHSLF
jgi:hypothetical protein